VGKWKLVRLKKPEEDERGLYPKRRLISQLYQVEVGRRNATWHVGKK